jgi:hypothetical protein
MQEEERKQQKISQGIMGIEENPGHSEEQQTSWGIFRDDWAAKHKSGEGVVERKGTVQNRTCGLFPGLFGFIVNLCR